MLKLCLNLSGRLLYSDIKDLEDGKDLVIDSNITLHLMCINCEVRGTMSYQICNIL